MKAVAAKAADVWRAGERVGTIVRTKHGAAFEYDERYRERHSEQEEGIAVHLPYARARIETTGVNLHTFFAGLLPEGLRLRELHKRTKTSEDDLLTLLMAAGPDTVGDTSVVPTGTTPEDATPEADAQKLHEVSFAALFRQSLAGSGDTQHPVIPGVQEKVSASTISFPLKAKTRRQAYILKLNPPDKPRLVENEYFFMRMARECGLSCAQVSLAKDKEGASGLLVQRFDRVWNSATSSLDRLHQEDACQFLDVYPAEKYRLSATQVGEGLEVCATPVVERLRLLELYAFSYVICNGDLHGKNVSILKEPRVGHRLAPAYDLLATLPYGDQRMALKLSGRDTNFRRRHFRELGRKLGVSTAATEGMLEGLVERAAPYPARLEEIGLDLKKTQHLRKTMESRLQHLSED